MLAEQNSQRELQTQEIPRREFLEMAALTALPLLRRTIFAPEAEASLSALVTVRNGQFYQHGKPIGFIGENWYSLGENKTSADKQICGPILTDAQRKQWMRDAKSLGMNVVRFWDFPELTANGHNTSAADRVLTYASQQGMLVYPTFENHFPNCDGDSQGKTTEWYANGYKESYLPYVKAMTKKYKGDPRIFAFQLINEAQCDDPNILRNFAYDVLNEVKKIDPQRLVTLGLLGVNQPGVVGANFKRLFTRRNSHDHRFDFMDIHDWPGSEHGSYKGLDGDSVNGIYARLQIAQELNMPLVISEIGRARTNGVTHQQAANGLRTEISHLLRYRHFAGLLGWDLLPRGVASDVFSYNANSAEARVLKQFANRIKDPRLR